MSQAAYVKPDLTPVGNSCSSTPNTRRGNLRANLNRSQMATRSHAPTRTAGKPGSIIYSCQNSPQKSEKHFWKLPENMENRVNVNAKYRKMCLWEMTKADAHVTSNQTNGQWERVMWEHQTVLLTAGRRVTCWSDITAFPSQNTHTHTHWLQQSKHSSWNITLSMWHLDSNVVASITTNK